MSDLKYRYDAGSMREPDVGAGASETGPPQSRACIVACWVALVVTVACNGLFESLKLGGVTSAEVSNEVFAWFAPAGYVFSIWGVVYAALILWMIVATVRGAKTLVVNEREAALFVVSCALNVGWLVAFHFRLIALSLVVIVALLAVIAALYASFQRRGSPAWTRVPFSLYLGWLSVAVFANAAHWVARMVELPLFINQVSTVLLACVLLGAAYIVNRRFDDWAYPLVVLWAAVGVGVRLLAVDSVVPIALFVLSGIAIIVIYVPRVLSAMRGRGERYRVGES